MKGQINLIYIGILTLISLAIFGTVVIWNFSITESSVGEVSEKQMDIIANQVLEDINFLSTQLIKHTYISESEIIIPHDKTSWVLNSGGVAAYSTKLFPYDVNFSEEWLFRYKSQQKILSSNNCEELYFYIQDVKAEINLIVSTEKDTVSSLQNKCDIEIIIFEE